MGIYIHIDDVQHLIALWVAVILLLIGMLTNSWAVYELRILFITFRATAGLFRMCHGDTCGSLKGIYDDQKVAVIMIVFGVVSAVICAVLMTVHFYMKHNNDVIYKFPTITFVTSLIGSVLIVFGAIWYAVDIFGDGVSAGYSFYLTLIGVVFYVIGGILSSKK